MTIAFVKSGLCKAHSFKHTSVPPLSLPPLRRGKRLLQPQAGSEEMEGPRQKRPGLGFHVRGCRKGAQGCRERGRKTS